MLNGRQAIESRGGATSAERSLAAVNDRASAFRLFTEGDDLYEAMLAAIKAAQKSVRLETYIFAADEVGWRFAEALAEKARAGVDVRFHFDARGAATGASPELYQCLINAGVKLKWYNPWSSWHPSRYFRRNHRKLLVVDEEELFLGGSNIILENSRLLFGEARTRDTDVAVKGELARQAAVLFDQTWDNPELRHKQARATRAPEFSGLYHGRMASLHALAIRRATHGVYVTSPYFCPGSRVERALRWSARRGVDVRVLVPRNSDPPIVGWMTRSAYGSLMKAGIRVYEYLPPRKLHAKSVAINDEWSIVGSTNLDHWSLIVNSELALVAHDPRLGNDLREAFFDDLERSREVQPAEWATRGWRQRLFETTGWMARKVL
ncbi:MAG: phospholipase D-like domain-containing protein [bacterium]